MSCSDTRSSCVISNSISHSHSRYRICSDCKLTHNKCLRQADVRREDEDHAGLDVSSHLGVHQNQWQRPITVYGSNDPQWEVNLKASEYIGTLSIVLSFFSHNNSLLYAIRYFKKYSDKMLLSKDDVI